jgi:SIR2-like protein
MPPSAPPNALPSPPADLIEAIKQRRIVLVIGSGLSSAAGGPTWHELLLGLAAEAQETQPQDGRLIAAALGAIRQGRYLDAASVFKGVLGREFHGAVRRQLQQRRDLVVDEAAVAAGEDHAGVSYFSELGEATLRPMAPTRVHRMLCRLGAKTILTTNYDTLLEQAWGPGVLPPVYQWSSPQLVERIQQDEPLIVKVHGDINSLADMVLTREEYAAARFTERTRDALRMLFGSRPVFWLGYGHNDPDLDLLWDECKARLGGVHGYSFALEKDLVLRQRLLGAGITCTVLPSHAAIEPYFRLIAKGARVPVAFPVEVGATGASGRALDNGPALAVALRSLGVAVELWRVDAADSTLQLEAEYDTLQALRRRVVERDAALSDLLSQFGVRSVDGLAVRSMAVHSVAAPAVALSASASSVAQRSSAQRGAPSLAAHAAAAPLAIAEPTPANDPEPGSGEVPVAKPMSIAVLEAGAIAANSFETTASGPEQVVRDIARPTFPDIANEQVPASWQPAVASPAHGSLVSVVGGALAFAPLVASSRLRESLRCGFVSSGTTTVLVGVAAALFSFALLSAAQRRGLGGFAVQALRGFAAYVAGYALCILVGEGWAPARAHLFGGGAHAMRFDAYHVMFDSCLVSIIAVVVGALGFWLLRPTRRLDI